MYFIFRKKVIKPGKKSILSSSTSVTSEASLYTAIGTDEEFHDMSSENEESQHSNILNEKYIILFLLFYLKSTIHITLIVSPVQMMIHLQYNLMGILLNQYSVMMSLIK